MGGASTARRPSPPCQAPVRQELRQLAYAHGWENHGATAAPAGTDGRRNANHAQSNITRPPQQHARLDGMAAPMRCLVTGASGYIGGRLVPELLAAGHSV